jgi:hypothetical protein
MAMIGYKPPGFGAPVPPLGMGPEFTAGFTMPPAAPAKPKFDWMAVLADALSGAAGMQPMAAQRLTQERREQTALERGEQQYRRRREDERSDFMWKDDYARAHPDPSPMLRDAQSWMQMTPEQRAAYQAAKEITSPDIATTLPNGQFYAGPRSGLAAALGGAQTTAPTPPKPTDLEPIGTGGAGPPAPRRFPGYY